MLKEDPQALVLLIFKCTDKKAALYYLHTSSLLDMADPSRKLYQPTAKHLFRNELIKLSSDSVEKNPPKNAAHIYD